MGDYVRPSWRPAGHPWPIIKTLSRLAFFLVAWTCVCRRSTSSAVLANVPSRFPRQLGPSWRPQVHQAPSHHQKPAPTDQSQEDLAMEDGKLAPDNHRQGAGGSSAGLGELPNSGPNLTITGPKTIETAVFVDMALSNKFGGKSGGLAGLNKLVLTIMSQVQHLFRYSSLKIPMSIKLVLIELMRDSSTKPLPSSERGDIDAYLSNFCNWQQRRLEADQRTSWDHAILLSGLDLYKASQQTRNHSGVLGLAWVGGMCKANYSCTINEASSLESAFVIAHELGHSLGIMHDGQRNACDPNAHIMSERTGAGKVHWSRCSNNYLAEAVRNRQLPCLDTQHSGADEPMYDLAKLRAPGQTYPVNEQCRLAFGANYTSFVTRNHPFNAVCRELWCVSGSWAKAAHPALEGSACGDQQRVCSEGKCARSYKSANPATDDQTGSNQQPPSNQ